MYTYEDLLKNVVVHCKNSDEMKKLIEYIQSQGEHKSGVAWFSKYDEAGRCIDILEEMNPNRNILDSEPGYCEEELDSEVIIVRFEDIDMFSQAEIDINKFEDFLLNEVM